jgi:hypothetical protein
MCDTYTEAMFEAVQGMSAMEAMEELVCKVGNMLVLEEIIKDHKRRKSPLPSKIHVMSICSEKDCGVCGAWECKESNLLHRDSKGCPSCCL